MPGAQNKKKTPGAFKSCLIPYQAQIFTWWFDERQTATEIQYRLQTEHGLKVHRTTITRFIKVRRLKSDPKQRPPHLQKTTNNITTTTNLSKITPPSKVKKVTLPTPPSHTPPVENISSKTSKKADTASVSSPPISQEELEANAMLDELENSTRQELWRKAQEAKPSTKKKK